MPRIISDELFDSLMKCVKDQRLLGVMGLLERLRDSNQIVDRLPDMKDDMGYIHMVWHYTDTGRSVPEVLMEIFDGPTTNNN